MNQPGCIVCSSSSPLPLFKIYTRFENRGINFKYIHPVCLLFFDNSDWIYDNEYVTKNVDLVEYKHN